MHTKSKTFADRLYSALLRTDNPTVMGLDPQLSILPPYLLNKYFSKSEQERLTEFVGIGARRPGSERYELSARLAELIGEFNRNLIDVVADIIPAVKPQVAFYEQLGQPGIDCLEQTMRLAREKGLLVIADAKRGDIGSTAQAYAAAWLGGESAADALTVNPYLGTDGMEPFLAACRKFNKGLFILVRTSNPSASELQDLEVEGEPLYAHVARLVAQWGNDPDLIGASGFSSIGAVVGATWPAEAKLIRDVLPRTFFLIPGYGAQGGAAEDCAAGFAAENYGALVNASRSLIAAWRTVASSDAADAGADYAAATRAAALRMRDELRAAAL